VTSPGPEDAIGDARRGLAWSAYDPIEGRLDSDDPLGFAAGAQRLADLLLPGLTVRTVRLTYYGMVCAGLRLVEHAPDDAERRRRFQVWERLWMLARVSTGRVGGLLGSEGAGRHLHSATPERLDSRAYVLLQRQAFLGALGSYSTSLEALGLKRSGSLILTEDGRTLGKDAMKAASSKFFANLTDEATRSIQKERDTVRNSPRWGASHDTLAEVGEPNDAIRRNLAGRLFDRRTVRGRAIRHALPAVREAVLPDLDGLRSLSRASGDDCDLAARAKQALAIERVTCAANFALERMLAAAVSAGGAIPVNDATDAEPRWREIEQLVREAAAHAEAVLATAPGFANEHATAAAFADLEGPTLVRELMVHHERVMQGRRARKWGLLDGQEIHALRLQDPPAEPARIRHTYRFGSARALAEQCGLGV
jgi:hypothetical protein